MRLTAGIVPRLLAAAAVFHCLPQAGHAEETESQRLRSFLDHAYAAYPGQALSYKIGELEILALRNHARERLGSRFDLKEFHDQILSGGSMPLQILREQVEHWLATSPSH